MSGVHQDSAASSKPSKRKSNKSLELYKFPILSPNEIEYFAGSFKELLFGARSASDRCEINPVSGYISYAKAMENRAATKNGGKNLPQAEQDASNAALAFLKEKYQAFSKAARLQQSVQQRYNKGKSLEYSFAPIPNPEWLKPLEVYPVSSANNGQADHWLCKFEIEIPVNKTRMKLFNASIDVRVGAAPIASLPKQYEIVGLISRFRPIVFAPSKPLEMFLEDTGNPMPSQDESEEEHAHGFQAENETIIAYMQSDADSPQFNLLPYEVSLEGGHHLNILPASKESLWVEFASEVELGKVKVYALIMGGSGHYQVKWAQWNTFGSMTESGEISNEIEAKRAHLQHSSIYDGVAVSELKVEDGVRDVAISVYDRQNGNVVHKVISLTVNPFASSVAPQENESSSPVIA